jgi:7-cyano-7-deazaguanine synthase
MTSALLLSGGQDSTAIAYWLRPSLAITVDYGQVPAEAEIRTARQICKLLNIKHVVVAANCSQIGSGDLNDSPALAVAPSSEWWPYRNQLVLTLAAAPALTHGASELLVGAVSTDSSHTDGTQPFFDAMDTLLRIQEGGLRVRAPAIKMTSSELIVHSRIPMDILYWSHSCHRSNFACGQCRGCLKHKNVIHELGHIPF